MKLLIWYAGCCSIALFSASTSYASPEIKSTTNTVTSTAASLGKLSSPNTELGLKQFYFLGEEIQSSLKLAQSSPSNQGTNPDSLRKDLKIEPLVGTSSTTLATYSPGLTFATPSAFGAGYGDAFVGASTSTSGKLRPDIDAAMTAGFGLGSSNTLGLEVSYNLGSFKRFGANGSFDLKAHRVVYAEGTNQIGVAAGWNTFAQYGNEGVVPSSLYGAVSSYSQLKPNDSFNKMPISATIGAGGGGFRQGNASTGIFAGVGVQVHPQLGVGFGWSGVGVNAGLSYVPSPSIPLTIGLTGGDLASNSPGGSVLVLSVGYGFNFLPK